MPDTGKKILIIDGHSILNRAFYGLPDLTNYEGLHTNAVLGFLNIIFKIIDEDILCTKSIRAQESLCRMNCVSRYHS